MTASMPHSREAEWSVVGQMLQSSEATAEVIGAQVEPTDFFNLDTRLIFESAVEAYYADDDVDPVTVAERKRQPLAIAWDCDEGEVASKLASYVGGYKFTRGLQSHVELLRKHGDNRKLMQLAQSTMQAISANEMSPQEIGDMLTTEAAAITAGKASRGEILPWMDVGRDYLKYLRRLKLARDRGIELAAYTGLDFIDSFSKGIAPTELCMVGGEPGVGKSAVVWAAAEGFARRQQKKPAEHRVGTLILSLEMGLIPSSGRLATSMTRIDSGRLREGDISTDEMQRIAQEWARYQDLGIYFNFASNFRLSQLRALIVEAIRRHNVGLIVLDHFRMVDPDRRVNNPNQEDEAKARFLKENICKDLDVAVICLAHTVKIKREGSDGRPTLNDLRGSYQVAAHCDMVGFIYRPWMYATDVEKEEHVVHETDAEMIWAKNRNGQLGSMPFYADMARMDIKTNP